MIVRELVTRLGFQTDTASLQKYEGAVDQAKRTAEKAATAMKAAFAAVGVLGLAAVGKKLAEISDRVNTLKGRLGSLSQGGDFDQLADRARSLGAGMDDYIDGYIMLANATDGVLANQQDVIEILDTLNAGLKASGADAGTAAGVMRQFGQALGSGALRGDELNSMNEGAGVLMRELARSILGPQGTVGALKKMAEQGKLTTDVVLAGMRKIGPSLRAQTEGMGRTVGQAAQGLRDTIDRVIARFDAVTGFTAKLAAGLDWLSRGIERGIEWLGGAEVAAKALGATLAVLAAVALPATTAALWNMARASWAAMAPFLPIILAVTAALAGMFLAFQDIFSWMEGRDSIAGRIFGPFEEAAKTAKGWIASVRQWVSDLFDDVTKLWDKIASFGGIKDAFNGVAGSIGDGISAVGDWFSGQSKAAVAMAGGSMGLRQNVTANTTINIQGRPDQGTINEIGRVTDKSVRGAASAAGKR